MRIPRFPAALVRPSRCCWDYQQNPGKEIDAFMVALEAASRGEGRAMTVVLSIALGLYLICGRVQIESNILKTLAYPNRVLVKFTVRTWGLGK
jgi:hypothetical protein